YWSSDVCSSVLEINALPLRCPALLEALENTEVLVLMRQRTPVDAALLDSMPALKRIAHARGQATGIDRPGRYRPARRGSGPRLRDGSRDMEPAHDVGTCRRTRCCPRPTRDTARYVGCGEPASGALSCHAPPDEC